MSRPRRSGSVMWSGRLLHQAAGSFSPTASVRSGSCRCSRSFGLCGLSRPPPKSAFGPGREVALKFLKCPLVVSPLAPKPRRLPDEPGRVRVGDPVRPHPKPLGRFPQSDIRCFAHIALLGRLAVWIGARRLADAHAAVRHGKTVSPQAPKARPSSCCRAAGIYGRGEKKFGRNVSNRRVCRVAPEEGRPSPTRSARRPACPV